MIKVTFIKEFATKKKGDTFECDSILASKLIRKKVAKKATKKIEK